MLNKHVPTAAGLMSLTKIINLPHPVNPSQIPGISLLQAVYAAIRSRHTAIIMMTTETVTVTTADIL